MKASTSCHYTPYSPSCPEGTLPYNELFEKALITIFCCDYNSSARRDSNPLLLLTGRESTPLHPGDVSKNSMYIEDRYKG